jgi:hypothetical protein
MIINDLCLTISVHLFVETKNTIRNTVETKIFIRNYFLFHNLTHSTTPLGDIAAADNLQGSSFKPESIAQSYSSSATANISSGIV